MSRLEQEWEHNLYQTPIRSVQTGNLTIETLNPMDKEIILDVGCGNAHNTIKIAKMIPEGKVVGIDFSSSMLELAKKNVKRDRIENVNLLRVDAHEMEFENEFDAIYSNINLHQCYDLKKVLALIYKALKIDGRIVLSIPQKRVDRDSLTILRYLMKSAWNKNFRLHFRQFQFFSEPCREVFLTNTLETIPFKEIKIECNLLYYVFESKEQALYQWKIDSLGLFLSFLPPSLKKHYFQKFRDFFFTTLINPCLIEEDILFIQEVK